MTRKLRLLAEQGWGPARKGLEKLLHASMIAALLPLAACMAGEPENDEEDDVSAVEGEIEIGVVEEGASEEGAEPGESEPGVAAPEDLLEEIATDYAAFGQTLPGGDRMAEPIPYPSDDPPKDTKMWPGDPSDPAPDDQH
jgi:hypothetical protein